MSFFRKRNLLLANGMLQGFINGHMVSDAEERYKFSNPIVDKYFKNTLTSGWLIFLKWCFGKVLPNYHAVDNIDYSIATVTGFWLGYGFHKFQNYLNQLNQIPEVGTLRFT